MTAPDHGGGAVVSLWHYPVKSMMGEELDAAEVTEHGLLGDRTYVVVDGATGKIASAKQPRKWGQLFNCHAAFVQSPEVGAKLPAVQITLPDGTVMSSGQEDRNEVLSRAFGRDVTLEAIVSGAAEYEAYWPEIEGVMPVGKSVVSPPGETVTVLPLSPASPVGTFFDAAVVHMLTTSSLKRLKELYPAGRFDVRRFRPNILVELASDERDFMENDWIGRTVTIGNGLRLRVVRPTPRCVMTTLPQGDLPPDAGVLRTVARHNRREVGDYGVHGCVGVYAEVLRPGTIRCGDVMWFE